MCVTVPRELWIALKSNILDLTGLTDSIIFPDLVEDRAVNGDTVVYLVDPGAPASFWGYPDKSGCAQVYGTLVHVAHKGVADGESLSEHLRC